MANLFASMAAWGIPCGLFILLLLAGAATPPSAFAALRRDPLALAAALMLNLVALPLLALLLAWALALPHAASVGLMLVASAPVGATANAAVLLAQGPVAFSLTLTALTSLAAPLTMPVWLMLAGQGAALPLAPLMLALFLTVVLPFAFGMIAGARWPAHVAGHVQAIRRLTAVIFAIIVALAILAQGHPLMAHGLRMLPQVIAYHALVMALAALIARWSAAPLVTAVLTATLRNLAVALALALSLLGDPTLALVPTLTVVVMNLAAAMVLVMHHRLKRTPSARRAAP